MSQPNQIDPSCRPKGLIRSPSKASGVVRTPTSPTCKQDTCAVSRTTEAAPDLSAVKARAESILQQMEAADRAANGKGVSGAFNSFLDLFSARGKHISADLDHARALVASLDRYATQAQAAGNDAKSRKQVTSAFFTTWNQLHQTRDRFKVELADYKSDDKFWASLAGDTAGQITGTVVAAATASLWAPSGLALAAVAGVGGLATRPPSCVRVPLRIDGGVRHLVSAPNLPVSPRSSGRGKH